MFLRGKIWILGFLKGDWGLFEEVCGLMGEIGRVSEGSLDKEGTF